MKWGNSVGIRLDKSIALQEDLQPNIEVIVKIEKRITTGREIFGTFKKLVDTKKELKKIDEMFND